MNNQRSSSPRRRCRCGVAHGPATRAVAAEYTLPRHREATPDEKKRAAVIYADALRQALVCAPTAAGHNRR